MNSEVNKEWMCDEGRYGFERFQPTVRATQPLLKKSDALAPVAWPAAEEAARALMGSGEAAMFLSPFLTLEDMWAAFQFAEGVLGLPANSPNIAMQIRSRSLTPVEAILISPDYAPNARGMSVFDAAVSGDGWRKLLEDRYEALLTKVRAGKISRLLLVGDMAILKRDVDEPLQAALLGCDASVAITPRGIGGTDTIGAAHEFCRVVLPGRTVNEKGGVMANANLRLQRMRRLLTPPVGSLNEWIILGKLAAACGKPIIGSDVVDERAAFREMVKRVPKLAGLTLAKLGDLGLPIDAIPSSSEAGEPAGAVDGARA